MKLPWLNLAGTAAGAAAGFAYYWFWGCHSG